MFKKIVAVGFAVAVLSAGAFGAGFMGTPTAELEKGQWNFGYSYMYSDIELERTNFDLVEFDGGGAVVGTETSKLDIEEFKVQRHYAVIGYGVENWWELYFQLGGADVKSEIEVIDEGEGAEGYNFDNDFAWGWGTRVTFHREAGVSWGVAVQMNWLDTEKDDTFSELGGTVTDSYELETYDFLLSMGPTFDMGGWKLYGGPFYYCLDGDLDLDSTETGIDGGGSEKGNADLQEEDHFGGFIGAMFPLGENSNMIAEVSFTGSGYAVGTGFNFQF